MDTSINEVTTRNTNPLPGDANKKTSIFDADDILAWCNKLSYRMHLTRGARFQAARRHGKKSTASTWAVTALSMYVFSASSFLAVYDPGDNSSVEKPIMLLTIIMSAFIIAFSIMEQGKRHDLKAELFLKCAQKIGELRERLELDLVSGELDEMEARSYLEEYNEIVNGFSDNHSETDYRTFRVNIGKHTGRPIYSAYQHLKYWLDCWLLMYAAILIPPISFAFILWAAPGINI